MNAPVKRHIHFAALDRQTETRGAANAKHLV